MTEEGDKTVILDEDTALSQTETQKGDKVALHGGKIARGSSKAQEGDRVAVVGEDIAQTKGGGKSLTSPGGDTSEGEYIEAVNVKDYENVSGNNKGYADFTDGEVIDVSTQGATLDVEIATGGNTNYVNAWIDTDEDGEFTDEAVEKVGSASAASGETATVSTELSIPSDLAGDLTEKPTLRITSSRKDRKYPPSENESYFGETEDYPLRVYPAPVGQGDEYIKRVSIKTMSNLSRDNEGYADYTNLSFEAGSFEEVEVEVELATFDETNHVNLWIDTDYDTEFTDEKNFYIGKCSAAKGETCTVSNTIKIPGMEAGEHRLRITSAREDFNNPPLPGGVYYGETEDYTIEVPEGRSFPPDTLGVKITSVTSPVGYGQNAKVTAVIKNTKSFTESGNATLKIQERDGSYTPVDTVSINSLGSFNSVTKTLTWSTDFGFPTPEDGKETWGIKVDTEADGTQGIEDSDTDSITVIDGIYILDIIASVRDPRERLGTTSNVVLTDVNIGKIKLSWEYDTGGDVTTDPATDETFIKHNGRKITLNVGTEDASGGGVYDFGAEQKGDLILGVNDGLATIYPP
jgi:hypothetical protein